MLFKNQKGIVGALATLLVMVVVFAQLSCDTNKNALEECRREADSLRADLQSLIDSISKSIELDRRYFRGPIKIFYYNVDSSRAYGGPCSFDDTNAVLPVERSLSPTRTPVEDAIELWIAGELTEEERAAGFISHQFKSLKLKRSVLHNGILDIKFDDPLFETSGGSCKARNLWMQVKRIALQFPQVREVGFPDGEEFQP